MQRVLGNGAVVVKATTPAKLNSGVSDVSHHHTPWGAGGTCTKRQSTLSQKWAAPNLSQFYLDSAWLTQYLDGTSEGRRDWVRGQRMGTEGKGGESSVSDSEAHKRCPQRDVQVFPALNLELLGCLGYILFLEYGFGQNSLLI